MINYQVFFKNPELHYIEIEMSFKSNNSGDNLLYLPVWTPGSYMVREFSKNVDKVEATTAYGKILSIKKIKKNQWLIQAVTQDIIIVKYRVYANELTVRTNHVDDAHALLNGAATFMAVSGQESSKHRVVIHPFGLWSKISTSLHPLDNIWHREASDYDELVDSPIEIGNQKVIEFEVERVPHQLALVGVSNMEEERLIRDLSNVLSEEIRFFKATHPCSEYLFILNHTEKTYGGLEHKNSSVNMTPRWSYEPREKYLKTISLLAHEYFHLWNIKRIRPVELDPFDYQNENYTRQLWAIEGITSYYDDYFVYLGGVSSRDEYLDIIAKNYDEVISHVGNHCQSLADSSFDTWIKYYRPNENTHNTQVSYYVKGSIVALMLNLSILKQTAGEKSLDDVMRLLYRRYITNPESGYTEQEFREITEQVMDADLSQFYDDFIYGTSPLNLDTLLFEAGLKLTKIEKDESDLGWNLEMRSNNYFIQKVEENGCAAQSGLQANDEILAINGFRMNEQWNNFIAYNSKGDPLEVIVARAGIIKKMELNLIGNRKTEYVIREIENPTAQQLKIKNAWLKR